MIPTPPHWLQSRVDLLIRCRNLLLLAGVALSAFAILPASRLTLSHSLDSLFDKLDPRWTAYENSKAMFGGDEFAIVAYRDPQLLTYEGMQRVGVVSKRLSAVEGVQSQSTQDLFKTNDNLNKMAAAAAPSGFKWLAIGIAHVKLDASLRELSEGVLLGHDQQTTGIVLRLLPESATTVPRGQTLEQIRRIATETLREEMDDENVRVYVAGEPVQMHDMFSIVASDGRNLFHWALILLAGLVVAFFRSLRWVVLPLAVVAAAILWTDAILVYSGMQLSMVSAMLSALTTVIGIAAVIHVTVDFRDRRRQLDPVPALRATLLSLAPLALLSTVTTAAGFVSLQAGKIAPVQSFGVMMAIAALMILAAETCLLPAGAVMGRMFERVVLSFLIGALAIWGATRFDLLTPASDTWGWVRQGMLALAIGFVPGCSLARSVRTESASAPGEKQLARFLGRSTERIQRHPRVVAGTAVLVVLFFAIGLLNLRIESEFNKNFRERSETVQSMNFVESNLGGAGTWEVNFPAPATLNAEYLVKVRALAARLREMQDGGEPRLTKVIALTDLLDLIPGKAETPELIRAKLTEVAKTQPEFEPNMYDADNARMRIMLRAKERQPSEVKRALIVDVQNAAAEVFGSGQSTGMFVLLTYLVETLLRDQYLSFVLTAAALFLMMSIAFRSWRIGLASLAPNVFPIVVLIGGMGWLNLPINIGTAMIAAVSLGLSIDASIHYIATYRRARGEKQAGGTSRQTHEDIGRVLVLAAVASTVGFSVLILSDFVPVVHFGALVAAATFGGLIGNLTFFPLLLRWAERDTNIPGIPVSAVVTASVNVTGTATANPSR